MGAAPTPRQQALVDLLSEGPRTTRELAAAAGYAPGDPAGPKYVAKTVGRLAARGWSVRNLRPPGSPRGGYYVLLSRPCSLPAAGVCPRCGARLSRYNAGPICWPCERSALDAELAMTCPPSLFEVAS